MPDSASSSSPLLVASNRVPLQVERDSEGSWVGRPSSGGLVTALDPVLRRRGGTWLGWPGVLDGEIEDEELARVLERDGPEGYRLAPVGLSAREREDFYLGFSNQILWPLCHGLPGRCNFEARFWETYRAVNRRFASAIAATARGEDFVWVHDYHLMAAGQDLRDQGVENSTGFFLHIPFPAPDIFEALPWSGEVLRSLLAYDVLGFQTGRDRENFLDCVEAHGELEAEVGGDGDGARVATGERTVRVGAVPISIDFQEFHEGARKPEVTEAVEALRDDIGTGIIVLGVDRLDYTKGIPQKLRGFAEALERFPDLRGRVTLVQLVVPSRETIPEYHEMKEEIEGLVGRINGRYTERGWAPVLYEFGSWSQTELLAYYRAADVGLVTSLRDGMNLVSKEFCAASVDGRGALVLSTFAGSAEELADGALMVNPHDAEAVAEAVHRACTMDREEQGRRLAVMQERVREHDVHRWVEACLELVERSRDAAPSGGGDPPPGRRTRWGGTPRSVRADPGASPPGVKGPRRWLLRARGERYRKPTLRLPPVPPVNPLSDGARRMP